jgi:hypothetical protein
VLTTSRWEVHDVRGLQNGTKNTKLHIGSFHMSKHLRAMDGQILVILDDMRTENGVLTWNAFTFTSPSYETKYNALESSSEFPTSFTEGAEVPN